MKHNKSNAQHPFLSLGQPHVFTVTGSPQNMNYKVTINDDFDHASQFEEIVEVLDSAQEGDSLYISLATDGGSLSSILPLLGAIDSTEAHVHIHCASDVASAGTMLLMKAHSISINDYVTVMFHEVSFGSQGNGSRVAVHVGHVLKSSERLVREMYKHFFNKEELDKMLSGFEFYMDKEEFLKRYVTRMELEQKDQDDFEMQAMKASRPKRVKKAAPKLEKIVDTSDKPE
jgi:ATP-dependent protease ClpP protease subunit